MLALDCLLVALAGVVGQWRVAGVFEIVCEQANGFVKNFRLDLVELVEERFRVRDFRKFEALLLQIRAVVFFNLGTRAANHEVLEDLLAGLPGVFPHPAEIELAVVLTVESFEAATKSAEEGFEVAHVRNGAGPARLEQLNLAQDVLRRVVQRRGRDEHDPLAPANLREHFVALGVLSAEAMRLVNEHSAEFQEVAVEQ
jgi:hypothetical protein